ncbi:RNA polymerase factor sigma-54 [Clostridium sediminicola]|uniref:RNA polymerase factor sigma-54 n=1 Tax=Clostridium sediminicola TaxID=3114879 RepID=UPI003D16478F
MEFDLRLTQEQKLIMTQQMQMSVKILQMSNFEIQNYIDKELQENPVLEAEAKAKKSEEEVNYKELIKYLDEDYNYSNKNYYVNNEEEVSPFNFISAKKSLKEYLEEQVIDLKLSRYERYLCMYIIEDIDSRGYLFSDKQSLAEELNIGVEVIEKTLDIIQNLDPTGIGAQDLKECLKIQLRALSYDEEDLYTIVDEYLELIADNKYNVLAKKLNVSNKKAQEYGDIIKTLEPKPSRGFYTGEDIKYIAPEAIIRKIEDKYFVIMNNDSVPKLNINNTYKNIIYNDEDAKTVKYVKEKINSAMFLMKSINQRENTIYRILKKLVEIQKDFFDYGKNYLKPLTLKEIAEMLEIHESTVSRAIRDKYIYTDKGTIKIKDLFTTGLSQKNSGDDVSTILIKNEIKEMVDNENKKKPYSDQKICDMLKSQDLKISRRTVAKYREELGIKSSSKRKRY